MTPWREVRSKSSFQTAAASASAVGTPWGLSLARRLTNTQHWQLAAHAAKPAQVVLQTASAANVRQSDGWQLADQRFAESASNFQKATAQIAFGLSAWQLASRRAVEKSEVLQTGIFKQKLERAEWQVANAFSQALTSINGASLFYSGTQSAMLWQTATGARPGKTVSPPIIPVLPIQISGDLLFECPPLLFPTLVFGFHPCGGLQPGASFSILPARFYMTTHNLIGHRLPDMAEVPLYDCTLSADVGSFAWQFSASGPESLFTQLAPTSGPNSALPQLLQITLDGLVWVFLVESLKRAHTFGKRSVSISGRSQTALVGAPWLREAAYNNPNAANAQQLAAQALDLSGVSVDWGITDWLVPANAWSYTGSVLAAVQAIAEAAGGYLQSHRSAPTLQVRHPYPPRPSGDSGGPWNWGLGAADVALATDAIITSGIERRDGADINAVYASGTSQGVLALIKRAGTAGDKLAAMQTDALITASQAAQQRGLAMLGKAGPQYAVSLELPVLTGAGQPGVIDVGSLVQVNDTTPWRGRVRGVQVNAAMPTARQTITLERHL